MTESERGSARSPELVELSDTLAEQTQEWINKGHEMPDCQKHKTYTVAEIKEKGLIDVSKILKQKKKPTM